MAQVSSERIKAIVEEREKVTNIKDFVTEEVNNQKIAMREH